MTYRELYESAINKLEKNEITLGEFEKMTEPLNAEVGGDSDTISRQQAIDVVKGIDRSFVKYIEELPPAQPERIRGRWIYHSEWANDGECGYECSVCHMGSDIDYNFFMRCGADMREVTT